MRGDQPGPNDHDRVGPLYAEDVGIEYVQDGPDFYLNGNVYYCASMIVRDFDMEAAEAARAEFVEWLEVHGKLLPRGWTKTRRTP